MQVWSGNVQVNGSKPQKELQDVHLHTSLAGEQLISIAPNATLTFLSFVDIANIPVYFLIGPSLDVYTNSRATEIWLSKHLLASSPDRANHGSEDEVPWWRWSNAQSEIGVLLQFSENSCAYGFGTRVTEVLIYATTQRDGSSEDFQPSTPPRSSSPVATFNDHVPPTDYKPGRLRVYAQLISSAIQDSIEQYEEQGQLQPSESIHSTVRFLTPPPDGSQVHKSAPGKRPRIETLFDDATRETKRALKRGGESVAKVMAGMDQTSTQVVERRMSITSRGENTPTMLESPTVYSQPPSARLPSLSRSMSTISPREIDEKLPDPRFIGAATKKRSSLNRVTSLANFDVEGKKSPVPEDINPIERQNKEALTKVVMAGMRLYGFETKKKVSHTRSASMDVSRASTSSNLDNMQGDELEYKNMYHQTFKAAVFVFRRSIGVQAMSQQLMRDIVDHLLAMFCNDPLYASSSNGFAQEEFSVTELGGSCT